MRYLLPCIIYLVSFTVFAQSNPMHNTYNNAYDYLNAMLEGDTVVSFKNAVFTVENAYRDDTLDYLEFKKAIYLLATTSKVFADHAELKYKGTDRKNMELLGALFTVMTTQQAIFLDSVTYLKPNPYQYDFDDFMGERDWSKMFVTKLLRTRTGNCHSLPYLYKIVADEIGAKCYLSFAPNHTYIKAYSKDQQIGWYNTELTNATFPIDAWIKSSGYVHLDAIRNGLYMDTLSKKQEIAVCLVDLAKGYERKSHNTDFVLKCANTALKYYPNYVNAMLLKAETLKRIFSQMMKEAGVSYAKQLFNDPKAKALYDEMEKLYFRIFQLGYRTMPKEMYVAWLTDLKEHKDKYLNKNLGGIQTKDR